MVHVAEEVVFLRLHVRRIVQRIAHQRRRFAQGQGKQALAVAIQVLVHRVAAGQRSGDEEHAAAPGDVFLQGLDARALDLAAIAHANHGEIGERPLRRGQVVGGGHFHLDALVDRQGQRDGLRVRRRPLAVDQEHGGRHRQVDDGKPLVVGEHGVGIQAGLDQVLAGNGEIDVELLLRRTAWQDLADLDAPVQVAVGRPVDGHVANRGGAEILHGDLHPPLHARGTNSFLRLQGGDRQVRPAGLLHAVDQPDLGVVLVERRGVFSSHPACPTGGCESR